jgi:hypothetical protein
MMIMLDSMFQDFNRDLCNDEDIMYDIKEYMHQVNLRFRLDINLSLYEPLNSYPKSEKFSIPEEAIPPNVNIRKIIKGPCFVLGKDYLIMCTNRRKGWFSDNTTIRLSSDAYRKVLIMSGEKEYIDYFMFLDKISHSYYNYQKQYERKTQLESKKRIQTLERIVSNRSLVDCDSF